jgi:N6-adenosine-specific RNA methylase IME4
MSEDVSQGPPFDIVYMDPPWDYKGQRQHAGAGTKDTGGAIVHYPTVTLSRLKEFPITDLMAPNSLLFMWVTNPHLAQGIDLIRSWDLQYATVAFVWDKHRVNPGFYTMSQCELCLVAKKGKIPTPRGARNIRQFVSEKRGKHSTKPSQVRDRITEMFPSQRKIEVFARQSEDGWSSWGFESGRTTCRLTTEYLAACGWGI